MLEFYFYYILFVLQDARGWLCKLPIRFLYKEFTSIDPASLISYLFAPHRRMYERRSPVCVNSHGALGTVRHGRYCG